MCSLDASRGGVAPRTSRPDPSLRGGQARKIVVIGASAAGLKAAARARRLLPAADICVLDERSFISYGACGLPYYLSGDIESLEALRKTPYGLVRDPTFFARTKGLDVRTGVRVERIIATERRLEALDMDGGQRLGLAYSDLVIATGAVPVGLPGFAPSDACTYFHTPEHAQALRQGLETGQVGEVIIVGAGFIGCELAGSFKELWGCEVTLVEAADHVLPQLLDPDIAALVAGELRRSGVRVVTGQAVTQAVTRDGRAVVETVQTTGSGEGVRQEARARHGGGSPAAGAADRGQADAVPGGPEDGKPRREVFEADRAVIAIGTVPRVDLAVDTGLALGPCGGIVVDAHLRTSVPGIYAAGDCIEVVHRVTGKPAVIPLGSLANRQGRVVGDNLAGLGTRFGPVAGCAGVKVFGWNVAAVGLSQQGAARAGVQASAVLGTWLDAAHYYPEHGKLFLKLVYEEQTGRLLGLQAGGDGDAVKRADVFASLLQRGGHLEDLLDLEFCYSPPYNAALDPLHGLGSCALNIRESGTAQVGPLGDRTGRLVVDVRLPEEITADQPSPSGAINIPLQELRERAGELSREGPLLIVCAYGTRSSEAARWLAAEGFRDVVYLAGGQMMQSALHE